MCAYTVWVLFVDTETLRLQQTGRQWWKTAAVAEEQQHHRLFLHWLVSLVLPGSAVFNRELQGFVLFVSHINHWQGYFKPRAWWYTEAREVAGDGQGRIYFTFVSSHVQHISFVLLLCNLSPLCFIHLCVLGGQPGIKLKLVGEILCLWFMYCNLNTLRWREH